MITFFEIGYCGHPDFPYAHIQLDKSTKSIISHSQEEDHPFIYDTLNNKKKKMVWLYFFHRPKKYTYRMDITNDYQKTHAFAPIYGDGSTDFHCHMISVVVCFLQEQTSKYVGGLRSYRNGLLWWLFGCFTTCQNNKGKRHHNLYFARLPMYHFQSNKICYSNNYCQGMG